MNEKPVTIIVSDVHLGGGPSDRGDDHVYDKGQFRDLIVDIGNTPEGRNGDVEFIINGDFLEFAQVNPGAYQLGSSKWWCSEDESLQKLEPILTGHADIFEAIKSFQMKGNLCTIAAGNHDVDLYWSKVRRRLQEEAGPVAFEHCHTWYQRYNGRLRISHGHMFDPANKFQSWEHPVSYGPDGKRRLEMCPGTLFMVKFVNWLEKDYPFADNIKPVTALGRILLKEDRVGLLSVGLLFLKFEVQHPLRSLERNQKGANRLPTILKDNLQYNDRFANDITGLYQRIRDPKASVEGVRQALSSNDALLEFLFDVLPKISPEEWLPIFDIPIPVSLGVGDRGTALGILHKKSRHDKDTLNKVATKELERDSSTQVIVMGHTHQPDFLNIEGRCYFNPGSWTKYVDLEKDPGALDHLTLEDFKSEKDFPYQLNYVRVECGGDHAIKAEMICKDYVGNKPELRYCCI